MSPQIRRGTACQIRAEQQANKGLWERGSRVDGGAVAEGERMEKSGGESERKKVLADSVIP